MIQRISKRFLSLLLVAVMVLALAPAITLPAFAATSGTVTGLSDSNIGLGIYRHSRQCVECQRHADHR